MQDTDGGDGRPVLFALHSLGSSAREFDRVRELLADEVDVVALDLPGFGDLADRTGTASGTDVDAMARSVVARIAEIAPARWMLLGHSMGGKVATVVASRVLDGSAPLFGLAGVVLVAASPLSPEPMDEARRTTMIGWAEQGGIGDLHARTFILGDLADTDSLDPGRLEATVADVRRTNPEAWRAWLERGSQEDWSERISGLPVPALILAGAEDGDLDLDAQRRLTAPAFANPELAEIDRVAHLIPAERPEALAGAVRRFWRERAGLGRAVPRDFARVLASDRTSARTRAVLAERALADDPDYAPVVLDRDQLDRLRLLADHLVPQTGPAIDLAARVDAQLATGVGDGWRPADAPPDAEAYRRALDALAEWARIPDADARGEALDRLGSGELASWLEDVAVDLARQWLAHPATMAEVGFDGIANGGDGERQQGFVELRAGRLESWEPLTPSTAARPESGAGAGPAADTDAEARS
ncbi:alpha/beta hydrolase [Schumannella sp. 10F1B-5-1]|uniref:alpha/beta hydrolase n=1 Tax=Schumannella sp. 10F1B-5-1 TaxID=2590780 RepID=UPI0015E87635|nr:alpha/beta hydrolase [Schumannella sp. 10F1B-5-1]